MAKQGKEVKKEESVSDEKERRSTARFYAILLSFLVVFLLFLNFWSNNFSFVLVQGRSMDNTLYSGEYLLATDVVHPEYEVERGDIIVVGVGHIPEWKKENAGKPDSAKTQFIIKRLIAIEGDIVRCVDGEMEICYAGTWDGSMNPSDYPFVRVDEPYAYFDESAGGKNAPCNTFEYTVGEGEIFFLGDNRNHSSDSRYAIVGEDGQILNEYSTLKDRLYKMSDVTATVSKFSLKHQKGLQKYLVEVPQKIKNFVTKPFKKLKG